MRLILEFAKCIKQKNRWCTNPLYSCENKHKPRAYSSKFDKCFGLLHYEYSAETKMIWDIDATVGYVLSKWNIKLL